MASSSKTQYETAQNRAAGIAMKTGRDLTDNEFKELLRMEPDRGTTNVRDTSSPHWRRWLAPESRCVVPFMSFSEFNKDAGGDIWFAFDDTRPVAFFARIWAPQWESARKVKEA